MAGSPAKIRGSSLHIVETALQVLASFSVIMPTPLRLLYGAALLFILIRVVEIATSNVECASLGASASLTIKALAKLHDSDSKEQWEKILAASLTSILDLFSYDTECWPFLTLLCSQYSMLVNNSAGCSLITALFSILEEMSYSKPDQYGALHLRCAQFLQSALRSNDVKVT